MHNSYDDIRSRIAESPTWFDENGVPRYGEFSPDQAADIYAHEVLLVRITCQGCGEAFDVCFARPDWAEYAAYRELIPAKGIHYGDPPNIGCCASGPSMNSEPRRVLQYWSRGHAEFTGIDAELKARIVTDVQRYFEWRRDPALEVDITPDWVGDDS